GEIEAVLTSHPGVAQAAVVTRTDNGRTQLVGYVVPVDADAGGFGTVDSLGDLDVDLTTGLAVRELRRFVAERLPEFMVPSVFVSLERLPLAPNGKLDRAALPEPEFTGEAYRAPRSDVEEILAGVYADVLGVERVGIDDDFFAIGGDSIRSIQIVSRARALGVEITARQIFERRTVAELADAAAGSAADSPLVLPELPGGGVGRMPLPPAARSVLDLGGGFARFSMSTVVDLPTGIDRAGLEATLAAVLDHHDILRTRLVLDDDGGHLEVTEPGSVDIAPLIREVVWAQDRQAQAAAELDAATGRLDPTAGVMAQFVWFTPDDGTGGRLLLVLHHLVVDAVSWRILLPDLAAAWRQIRDGQAPALPPVGTSARRWAHALTEAAADEARVAELDTWAETVEAGDPLLGTRALDPAVDVMATVRHVWLRLPARVTQALLTEVPAAFRGGVNDGLLAALALAVAKWRRARGVT
ncbi:condensation domain-containing protein, partial [Streptomyces aurantiogriseus]|uniref:condensation domain-containing protein n=1 Tax=Streptomyces aurantiogriseus TaxID=66870 RepID=UPI001E49C9F1